MFHSLKLYTYLYKDIRMSERDNTIKAFVQDLYNLIIITFAPPYSTYVLILTYFYTKFKTQ